MEEKRKTRREVQLEKKSSKKSRKPKKTKAAKQPKSKMVKQRRIGIAMIIIGLLIIAATKIYYASIVVPTRESANPLSILMIGSDVSDFREDYFMGTKPEKTDAIMVVTFNPNTYTVDLTSIPRDTSVDYVCDTIQDLDGNVYPDLVYQDQINELYQVSGKNMQCLEDTVSNFLNVPIDYYVKVNMDQLADIIDAVGGIDITVHAADGYLSQENASLTETYSWTNGEELHMEGDEALTYARARHDSEVDYGRGVRQQQVLEAIIAQILDGKVNLSLIKSIVSMLDTDMPAKLIYDYYNYVMELKTFMGVINSDKNKEVTVDMLPDTAWFNLYDMTGYSGDLIGTERQRNQEVTEFVDYLKTSNIDLKELQSEMLMTHQFYNSAYYGYYNVQYDQLYEVSNALRENLELEEEDVTVPQNQYGDNYAYGLMPSETTKAKQGLV